MKNSKTSAVIAIIFALFSLAACGGSSGHKSGNSLTNQQQGSQDKQYAFAQPLPYFPFSQIRQTLIQAEAIDALGITSTSFFFVNGVNHPVFSCPSIGVPIPRTDQLSNPAIAQWNNGGTNGEAGVPIGQEEPEGVFTGDTSGTDSMCVNSAGQTYLGINEGYTVAVTATAYWDNATGTIKVTGAPQMPKCTIKRFTNGTAEEVCSKP